jgi:predicted helicase
VFGIQVGVGITLAIRNRSQRKNMLFYIRLPEDWRKETKLSWLTEVEDYEAVKWESLIPDDTSSWICAVNQ